MGDPKKPKKKYETPIHPWIDSRIKEEKTLRKNYGLANKKEVWKMDSLLKRFKDQAKSLVARTGKQADVEREQLINRMKSLGLLTGETSTDAILGLSVDRLMDRRLQTMLVKKELARSMKQARQFITHNHVMVNGKIVNSPSYLVKVEEEDKITFTPKSPLFDENHPERKLEEQKLKLEEAEVLKKKTESEEVKPVEAEPETPKEAENE